MLEPNKLRALPNRSDHNCFGCSASNTSGLQMKFYTDEASVFSWLTLPAHLSGWSNLVHGGVISTILDEIMSWTAICMLNKFILTKSMTVDFMRPVFIGQELRAEGRIAEVRGEREALVSGALYNGQNKLCAKATGKFAVFNPEDVSKLGLLGEQAIRDFQELLGKR